MSSSSDHEPQSIAALYAAAESARDALLAHPDPRAAHASVAAALAAYDACAARLAAAALFSPNETLDDLATASLPYLLLDLRRADVLLREPFADPPRRRAVVRRARAAYEAFLALADGYGLVAGRWATLLERYRDDPTAFTAVSAGAAAGGDMAARREAKIASFRTEKALKQRLEALRADPRYRGAAADEDVVRQAHLAAVELAVHDALHGLDALNREMEMLAHAPERNPPPPAATADNDPNSRRRATEDDTTWRLDKPAARRGAGGGPLLSAQGRPLQPFTLVSGSGRGRAELRDGVFRSGHNLPTMSIDEYLEEERRRGNILSGGTDPAPPEPVDEDDEQVADRATYKAREWDDFKDENRRGAGNTMNMG